MRGRYRTIRAGDRFGRRTVVREVDKDARSHRYFQVRCDCGLLWIHRLDRLIEVGDGRPCRFCPPGETCDAGKEGTPNELLG